MAKSEISIDKYQLKIDKGNMKSLLSNWIGIPKVKISTDGKSVGLCATKVSETCEEANAVKAEFQNLLNNSIGFFEAAGIKFEEVDNNSADSIKND